MEKIMISPVDQQELELLKSLFEKMNLKAQILSEEDIEDMGLLMAMAETQQDQKVSLDNIMKILEEE